MRCGFHIIIIIGASSVLVDTNTFRSKPTLLPVPIQSMQSLPGYMRVVHPTLQPSGLLAIGSASLPMFLLQTVS